MFGKLPVAWRVLVKGYCFLLHSQHFPTEKVEPQTQSVIAQDTAAPGNVLEAQILRLHPAAMKSEAAF